MPRKYTPQERLDALAIYEKDGLATAARATGFPKGTIVAWAHHAGIQGPKPESVLAANAHHKAELEVRRTKLRGELLFKALDLLERMDKPHTDFKGKEALEVEYPIAPAAAVRDYANAAGILIDKFRLEMGEATGRTESRSLTDALDDHEKQKLRDWIDNLELDTAEEPAEGDPSGAGAEVRQ